MFLLRFLHNLNWLLLWSYLEHESNDYESTHSAFTFSPFRRMKQLLRKLMLLKLFLKKSMMGSVIAQLTLFQNLNFVLSIHIYLGVMLQGFSCCCYKNICDRNVWLFWQKCPWLTHRSITVERKSTSLEIENLWKGRNSRTQLFFRFFFDRCLKEGQSVLLLDLFQV